MGRNRHKGIYNRGFKGVVMGQTDQKTDFEWEKQTSNYWDTP